MNDFQSTRYDCAMLLARCSDDLHDHWRGVFPDDSTDSYAEGYIKGIGAAAQIVEAINEENGYNVSCAVAKAKDRLALEIGYRICSKAFGDDGLPDNEEDW